MSIDPLCYHSPISLSVKSMHPQANDIKHNDTIAVPQSPQARLATNVAPHTMMTITPAKHIIMVTIIINAFIIIRISLLSKCPPPQNGGQIGYHIFLR